MARFAIYLVSRFEIYFAIKIQSSAFAPRFQNPSEAAKRRPKTARRHKGVSPCYYFILCWHEWMKADWRISVKSYSRSPSRW
jgi:hypothetical protein